MDIGRVGVWTSMRSLGEDNAAEAARLAEELGLVVWLGGSPQLPALRPLLEATERLIVATGIANVWQNEPTEMASQYARLVQEFGDRVLVGIGIGHSEATPEYARPLSTMGEFLDGLDAAMPSLPPQRRCLAALGPKMLELCAARSRGAHPYFVPVAHTRMARERLGPDPLLAPEMACVLDGDRERARATARRYAALYLGLSNYVANLRRCGFSEADVADGGSDALIDAVVPQGSAEQIAAVAREHLDAGANHVALQPVGVDGVPRAQWSALAAALS